jgi:hypothetical protein
MAGLKRPTDNAKACFDWRHEQANFQQQRE